MLPEALELVAAAGGTAVVTAMATDSWESVKRGLGRLFGRGDEAKAAAIERQLEHDRSELARLSGAELEQTRDKQVTAWTIRLAGLLQEHPGAADQIRALTATVPAVPPTVIAGDQDIVVNGDLTVEASDGGVAAGVIKGSVSTGYPIRPGAGQA